MSEWCPDCECEIWEVRNEKTDISPSCVSISWLCKCHRCGCKFEIVRTYNLDPYYSYTQKVEE